MPQKPSTCRPEDLAACDTGIFGMLMDLDVLESYLANLTDLIKLVEAQGSVREVARYEACQAQIRAQIDCLVAAKAAIRS